MMNVDDFLEHHGVKGMKWGRRKQDTSTKPSAKQRRPSSDFKKVQSLKGRHPSTLTNKQLKELNDRLNLEQNFNRLNPTKVKKGHDRVKSLLAVASTAGTAYTLAKSPMVKDVGKMFVKK